MGRFLKHELSGWKAWEIIWLAAACTVITALSLHWGDDALGITMALTGVLCVILTGKGKMSCYLFGLVNTVLYAWIAFGARYYGEVMLNACYYVPMQFVGWFMWKNTWTVRQRKWRKPGLPFQDRYYFWFVRCLHLRLRAGIETIGRKPPLYRQHEHLPVRAGHASQCQAPYGAVDSMDCGGCGDCIHVVCGLSEGRDRYCHPADVVHLSVKRHVYVCKMVQGKRGTCQ